MSAAVPLPWPALSGRAFVVAGVIGAHAVLLWWAARASLIHPVESVVPVQLLQAGLTPPEIQPAPPSPPRALQPPQRKEVPPPPRRPEVHRVLKAHPPEPTPAAPPPRPAPPAPAVATAPAAPPTPAVAAQPPAPPAASAPAPAPAPTSSGKVELPISDADYLQNPKPEWPRASQRLGEKGLVMVRVLIGTDGRARKAEIAQSSGYPRLDNASVAAVLQWRYVPGKRGGVPEEMWVKVPIRWGD